MASADVLLITHDEHARDTVQSVLQSASPPRTANVFDGLAPLRARLASAAGAGEQSLALVDIDADPKYTLFEMSRIVAAHPRVRFIAVSRAFDEKLILDAMQAGARHILRKAEIQAELLTVLENLLSHGPQESKRPGIVLSVFSCSGGCGATTVAVNVANELRLATEGRALVVDLDVHYGAAASYLGVKGRYGVGSLLNRQEPIDRHLIQTTAVSHCDGLDLLLSPASAEADAGAGLHPANLLAALEVCRETYDHVVLDAPRVSRKEMLDLASVSQMSLLVFQLTVRDVQFAGSTIAYLTDHGIPRERILPLANRVRRRGCLLRLEDGERVIGAGRLCAIRSDWAKAIRGVDRGRLLAEIARRSGLRRDYRRLVAKIQECTSNGCH